MSVSSSDIVGHMKKHYGYMFRQKTPKPVKIAIKNYAQVEHCNRIIKLKSQILEIGTVITK